MSSRVYMGSGRPLEDELWLLAYAVDAEGRLRWVASKDEELAARLPKGFLNQGAIMLKPYQSCDLDFGELSLDSGFGGDIGVATSPPTSHVLMKIEVKVHNWGTSAFSHFRPGVRGAYALKNVAGREGLATDYIVTGAQVKHASSGPEADCLIAAFNIDEGKTGNPTIEVFDQSGFIVRKRLGALAGSACKHILLSSLFPELRDRRGPLTLRLTDESAVVILSALHIDYKRRDVAIDHGSDRFSTYIDYGCL
ncbi:MAG: hypothetical protein L0229_21830 [Blastocatellia bacterium]|nr:hypothetical protein [Blastocatellia bacterium]